MSTPVRSLLFQLVCPPVLLLGHAQVRLADTARAGAGWRSGLALSAWVPCRMVFVVGYRTLIRLAV